MDTNAESPTASGAATGSAELRLHGQNGRIVILNAHALLRHRYRRLPLWSMVGHLTGHGSGYSVEICRSANLDPMQVCGVKQLRDYAPNSGVITNSVEVLTPETARKDKFGP